MFDFAGDLTAPDWIALFTGFATLAAVVVAAIQLRKLNQQIELQHFADYTKRYQEIILEFPETINEKDFDLASHPAFDHTMRRMRAYFDLCFEEWYLNERRLIPLEIWEVWNSAMQTAFSKSAFRQAWARVKSDTNFGVKFERFVERYVT